MSCLGKAVESGIGVVRIDPERQGGQDGVVPGVSGQDQPVIAGSIFDRERFSIITQ